MEKNLISQIYVQGTSTPMDASSSPLIYEYTIDIPFLDFLLVAIIFGAAFAVFKITFFDLWKD